MKPMFRKLDQFPSSVEKIEERLFGWVQQKGYVILTLSIRPNSVDASPSLHRRKKTGVIFKLSFSLQNIMI